MKASDLLVACLEAEGVECVFGIPGEETVDLDESLDRSAIKFVPVRHEQAGAFMADAHGRLTGRAGVCVGTLGPGATNLVTGIANAFLDRAPVLALTGQVGAERRHKEAHQHLDVVGLLGSVTKWNARVADPATIPEVIRKAIKLAETEPRGPCHIEVPEDVVAADVDATPLPRTVAPPSQAPFSQVQAAAELIRNARRPAVLAGNGAVRADGSQAVRDFAARTGLPVAVTLMGKGLVRHTEGVVPLGTVGLQAGDDDEVGLSGADVVVAVGYDLVEHAPAYWNPRGDTSIVSVGATLAEIDAHFAPSVELVGDITDSLHRLADACGRVQNPDTQQDRRSREREGRMAADGRLSPPQVVSALREALDRDDVLVSDVGLHKLWIGRTFPAHEPHTVLFANGLAAMGFAVPAGLAAKRLHPDRGVLAAVGDGGFLMNVQELETAKREDSPVVCVVWEDGGYGSIARQQHGRFGRAFHTNFDNPDFVALARAFGLQAWRCRSPDELAGRLRHALGLHEPSVLAIPIDYAAADLGDHRQA